MIIELRKSNLSIYDIAQELREAGISLSPPAVGAILKEEGFARLPRRRDEERPGGVGPEVAPVADVRELDLTPRTFSSKFGGLFLFVPYLVRLGIDKVIMQAGFPGSRMIPAPHAIRSLLGLKLFGNARHSHVMSNVFDQGLALFAGLNVIPKRSFLTEYSCRIDPTAYPTLLHAWFDAVKKLGICPGQSFDLDFHTIPFHGEDALMQKHYVSKRSRRQKGLLAFLASDADNRLFCYVNADVRKENMNDEIIAFAEFWKDKTGHYPKELIFDSKLTTYRNLNRLTQELNINFITLRRRSPKMLAEVYGAPASAWRRVRLENVGRIYRTPKVIDRKISLTHYSGRIRQLAIMDLGHEEPTFLITNQMTRSPGKLIERYARRMIIENTISEAIDFFHMDALSSAVALKVNCDLAATLMGSSLYRALGKQIGHGYETAKASHIFRDLIDTAAKVVITDTNITVRFQKRAHNPLLVAAGLDREVVEVPWLGGKRLDFHFG